MKVALLLAEKKSYSVTVNEIIKINILKEKRFYHTKNLT